MVILPIDFWFYCIYATKIGGRLGKGCAEPRSKSIGDLHKNLAKSLYKMPIDKFPKSQSTRSLYYTIPYGICQGVLKKFLKKNFSLFFCAFCTSGNFYHFHFWNLCKMPKILVKMTKTQKRYCNSINYVVYYNHKGNPKENNKAR